MTVDLVRWLTACLDADEQIARAAIEAEFLTCGRWLARGPYGDGDRYGSIQSELNEQIIEDDLPWPFTEHAAEHDPARVLRAIDARRRELALHHPEPGQHPDFCGHDKHELPCPSLRIMALEFADRDGYREEWRP